MVDKDIKVTDKRMFTPDGELREEYRFLEERAEEAGKAEEKAEEKAATGRRQEAPGPAGEPAGAEGRRETEPVPGGAAPPLEIPGTPPELGAPTFFDLVAILAEPVALYLGDAQLPEGKSMENLEMARLHIDLLDLLRTKTAGNLSSQEAAALEDLLYRLRLRYVQKRG